MFFLLIYRHTDDGIHCIWWFSENFWPLSGDSPNWRSHKCCQTFSKNFRRLLKISEHCWRLSSKALAKRRRKLTQVDASWRKLKTWVNLRLRLARACVHLRWLAMTCAHFGRDQSSTCVHLRLLASPFGQGFKITQDYILSPGQTATQAEDLGQLATSFGQGLSALALTCDDLRSLWSRSNLHASQNKFFTVWPPNPSQSKLSTVH